jgi:hypothetical protein
MPTVAESYGKQLTVNNAAERMNSVIQDLRHQLILNLLVGLSRWTIGKSFEHREKSKKWIELGCRLTEFAQAHHIKCMEFAMQRHVFVTHHKGTQWKAYVSHLSLCSV